MTRPALAVAAAAGLLAGAATDAVLAALGTARIDALQVGTAAAPLLVLALSGSVRRALVANAGSALLVFGCAWTAAPLIDQHLTHAVVIDRVFPDLVHHLAGWPAAFAGARLLQRPKTAQIS